ncbi:hypothetical protein CAC42_1001 [Sphaceloma murrayae]|uniref:Uncharacterized protein n=1 Tax=Sphaceloma murrayae TaxID=2082308 RepID=A0A2K1R1R3_9PEZI|nr:hypothetical protein CAC42_1001 [Sphaceloma murrayae]
MANRLARPKEPLLDSWASLNDDANSVESVDFSDEDTTIRRSGQLPGVDLSASRTDHLRDALGSNAASAAKREGRSAISMQGSTVGVNTAGPHQRLPRPKQKASAQFVMPTLDHTSSHESSPVKEVPRQSRPDQYEAKSRQQRKRTPLARTKPGSNRSAVELVWLNFLSPILTYVLQVFGIAANFAKPMLGYVLAIYLLVGGMIMARNMLFNSLNSALAPVCRIPGAGLIVPFCTAGNFTQQHGDVEFDKLISTQATFEEVLTTSAESASLPMDMKRSESSIRDLRHVVEYSALPSRNELVFEFTGFIDTARQASNDLTKYNSRIGRAVDRILSTNRWTLQVLEGVEMERSEQGSISRFIGERLDIFAPFRAAPTKLTRDILYDQYIRHTSAVEDQIQALIIEAQALLAVLQNLDDRLDLIASIAMRDGIKVRDNNDELWALLWTKLGGNRASVSRIHRQLAVLKEVGAYRKLAFAHVSGTIIKLQGIAAALEDLRERVARPEVLGVGSAGSVRRDEIPLEMHIGEIVMGVERLETVREDGRRIEGQRLRNILDKEDRVAIDSS